MRIFLPKGTALPLRFFDRKTSNADRGRVIIGVDSIMQGRTIMPLHKNEMKQNGRIGVHIQSAKGIKGRIGFKSLNLRNYPTALYFA